MPFPKLYRLDASLPHSAGLLEGKAMALSGDFPRSIDYDDWWPAPSSGMGRMEPQRIDHHGNDLRQLQLIVTGCFGLACKSLCRIGVILAWRAHCWFKYRVIYSLFSAWLLAGLGWGATFGLAVWLLRGFQP